MCLYDVGVLASHTYQLQAYNITDAGTSGTPMTAAVLSDGSVRVTVRIGQRVLLQRVQPRSPSAPTEKAP
jgi:hypothetical protein